jgi:hypothetical protein
MRNNGNEDEGEVGGNDGFDWPPSDEETSHINFRSISIPVTLLMTPVPTPHSDVPALTHVAMPFSPSDPAMPIPSAIHKQKNSALAVSGSPFPPLASLHPLPLSAKRHHISKIIPDYNTEDVTMSEHMDNFAEAFHVATGVRVTLTV